MTKPITWKQQIWREFHAGNLTRAYRDVLLTLYTFRGPGGGAWPSHATLAARACCHEKTVQRALKAARDLGLVSWVERRVKAAWRWLRTSNLYRFPTTGQNAGGAENQERKKDCIEVRQRAPVVLKGALEPLAAIAARRMRALGLG